MPSSKRLVHAALAALLAAGLSAAAAPAFTAIADTTPMTEESAGTGATTPSDTAPDGGAETAGDAIGDIAPDPAGDPAAAGGPDSAAAAPAESAETTEPIEPAEAVMPAMPLEDAVDAAADGAVIEVSGAIELTRPLGVTGKSVTLRAVAPTVITRAAAYPRSGGLPDAMVRLGDGGALTLDSASGEADSLVLDGGNVESNEALVRIDGAGAAFTQRTGATVQQGRASYKPWAGVYVRNGEFRLDGGVIRNCRAQRNAAIAVERSGRVVMTDGAITGNHATYSEASVWIGGVFEMSGGSITANGANYTVPSGGMVQVLGDGVLVFTGGTIGESTVSNRCAVILEGAATLRMGSGARIVGERDHIRLNQGTVLVADSPLAGHDADSPVPVVLQGAADAGRLVATAPDAGYAATLRTLLRVSADGSSDMLPLMADPTAPNRLVLPTGDAAELMDLLDSPYADNLGYTLRPELLADGAFDDLRARLDAFYGGAAAPDAADRYERLAYLERQKRYLERERDAVEASTMTLSQLGSAASDRTRTQHMFRFDNLDITGYYLGPGARRLNLYLDADDPSAVRLAWRQVGRSENNSYESLNMGERSGLRNGENRIAIDLSGRKYGSMLFLINDSADNAVRARLEGADANAPDAPAVTGTQLGRHPFYVYDAEHPERFWDYVRELRDYVRQVRDGAAQDMTMIQLGDGGNAQFSMRASLLAGVLDQESVTSSQSAAGYVGRANAAVQEWLDFYWSFEGFDPSETGGPNAPSPMRVHISFTSTVSSPSTMYAFNRYFHMPEGVMRSFLNGSSMYGWGMSHEYGHMLDNTVFSVPEETNNLFSLAGARHGAIMAMGEGAFSTGIYHGNVLRATRRWDERLARIASDPGFMYDWNENGVWGEYIWAHLVAWWNGLHYFDGWDYADYDYGSGPYTAERAAEVRTWGAYGAMTRMLRGEPGTVAEIDRLTAGISNDGQPHVQYNRLAVAATMAIGYDFADYLAAMGQNDLSPAVREYCARYPKMPRKVTYYSVDVDAAEINGAKPFDGPVDVGTTVSEADGAITVDAALAGDAAGTYVAAWELYRNDELVGFSRTPRFVYAKTGDEKPEEFRVVAYDVRLNPNVVAADEDPGDAGAGDSDGVEPGTGDDGSGDSDGAEPGTGGDPGSNEPDGDGESGGGAGDPGDGDAGDDGGPENGQPGDGGHDGGSGDAGVDDGSGDDHPDEGGGAGNAGDVAGDGGDAGGDVDTGTGADDDAGNAGTDHDGGPADGTEDGDPDHAGEADGDDTDPGDGETAPPADGASGDPDAGAVGDQDGAAPDDSPGGASGDESGEPSDGSAADGADDGGPLGAGTGQPPAGGFPLGAADGSGAATPTRLARTGAVLASALALAVLAAALGVAAAVMRGTRR